jgi:hypothetical protein
MLLDRLFRRTAAPTTGRHRAAPRLLSTRQARRAAARLAEAATALPTVAHRDRLAEAVAAHLDGETRRMPGAELLAALTDETRADRVPGYLAEPYSGATA